MNIRATANENIAVFDQANDIIFLHDARTGAIINLNEKAYQFFGYSLDEIRKQKKLEIYLGDPPYSEKEILRLIKKAAEGEPQIFKWQTQTKSGEIRLVEVSLNRIDLHNRETVLAIIRDIPPVEPNEPQLHNQEDYITLLKNASMTIVNSGDQNDIMIAVANHGAKLLGTKHGFIYLVNDVNSKLELAACTSSVGDFLTPEIKMGESLAGKVWMTGEPGIVTNYGDWKDRSIAAPGNMKSVICAPLKLANHVTGVMGLCYLDDKVPGDEEIKLLGYFAELASNTLNNIRLYSTLQSELTKRNHAKPIRKTQDDWYQSLFDGISDCVYLAEVTEFNFPGVIIEANASLCEKLGYSKEEILSLTPADIIPLEHRGDLQSQMETLSNEQQVLYESAHMTKSGISFPVEINSLLLNFDGKQYILSVVRDISQRKRLAKEVATTERLDLVGSMAAGIGQEIRNPLTTVRGFLQMLISKEDCQEYCGHLELMLQEIDRANAIITDFLSLAKAKPSESRRGNLNTIIGILLPLLEAGAILYHKTIKTELGDIPDIPLDDKDIRQLILNLVRNGLDAMPPRGTLTIRTVARGKEVLLSVQDQGKGIPPDVSDKLGTPFFTTKEYGVGLGLAVCYSIAARHNATINFESNPTGTVFHVRFKIQ